MRARHQCQWLDINGNYASVTGCLSWRTLEDGLLLSPARVPRSLNAMIHQTRPAHWSSALAIWPADPPEIVIVIDATPSAEDTVGGFATTCAMTSPDPGALSDDAPACQKINHRVAEFVGV
jgi:hypothetical protein